MSGFPTGLSHLGPLPASTGSALDTCYCLSSQKSVKAQLPLSLPFPNTETPACAKAFFDLNDSTHPFTSGLYSRLSGSSPHSLPARFPTLESLFHSCFKNETKPVYIHLLSKDCSFSRLSASCLICFPSRAVHTEKANNARLFCF